MVLPAKQENTCGKIAVNDVENGSGRIPKKGYYYKAGAGDPVASAWRVQEQANEDEISTEILSKEWNDRYIEVVARGHHPKGYYVDAIVVHEFKALQLKKVMEYFKKVRAGGNILFGAKNKRTKIEVFKDKDTPFIMDEYGNQTPNLTGIGQAKLLDDMLDLRIFGIRDATTKAMKICQEKLTNQDWREDEEVKLEEGEVEQFADGKDVNKVDQAQVDEEVAKKEEIAKKKADAKKKAEQKKKEDAKQKGKENNVKTQTPSEQAREEIKKSEEKAKAEAIEKNKELKKQADKDEKQVKEDIKTEPKDTDRIPQEDIEGDYEITEKDVKGLKGDEIIRKIITGVEFDQKLVTTKTVGQRLMSMKKAKWVTGKIYMEARKHLLSLDLGEEERTAE